ncbi:glycine-rich domain-containing protein [Enterobacter roggenkampii]|uniref:glycine-rich domain-containing protein n=1 Tax=Enterobacter roggenkampii TaxID=1812935 RepID=UPI00133072D4|nr:hypothetical protein [Enterobacter roggenkampii]
MNRSDAPSKKSVPFGINGPREAILDTTPAGNNQASYDSGFPPITMILKSAGGLPPKGEDFNQILYELATDARWGQAGGGYQYDSAFSTGISGYPIGSILQNSTGDGTWINTTDGNTNNPEVATASPLTGWIPLDSNGYTTKSGLTNANVTLTTLEASRERIILSGTLTANINLIVPAWSKKWTVVNNCSGSFSVTIKTTSGTGISIPAGMTAYVVGDGTNIIQDTNLLGISGRFINTQIFTSSGTYTPSAGTKKIKVYATGGGGGGGGSAATDSTTRSCGGGGGAGSTVISVYNISDITTPVSITIGSGGSAGAGGGSAGGLGGTGGSTTFGSLITATGATGGGGGGQATDSGSIVNANGGAISGSTAGNIVTARGSSGLPGITSNVGNVSGAGGSSFFCGGGNPISSATSTNGDNGINGSGGSGGMSMKSTAVGKSGGVGGSGIVIIEEYA